MIGAVLNLGSFFLDIAKQIYPDSKDIGAAADVAGKVRHSYNVVSTSSVHKSANRAVIAPLVGVEASLLHQEYMQDVMGVVMLRDIVATLTHLSMQSSVAVGVKMENLIGSISPNRGGMMSLSGCEALNDNLPNYRRDGNEDNDDAKSKNPSGQEYINVDSKSLNSVSEYTPLAVGKTVVATIVTEQGVKQDIPLTFRQIPVPTQQADMERIFSAVKQEDGFFIRLFMTKDTKELTWPEFLGGRDIIKDRFKIRNDDMSGFYKEAMRRETGNKLAALRSGTISMNTMANSFIMDKSTQNKLELSIGKRFRDYKSREQIFSATNANTIVVCDEDRGIFTFYTHGMDMVETYTRKDIAIKSKKDTGSNNLADLVKLLNGGM